MASRAERIDARARVNARDIAEAEAARAARAQAAAATAAAAVGAGNPAQQQQQQQQQGEPAQAGNPQGQQRRVRILDGDADVVAARELAMTLAFKRLGMKDESAAYLVQDQDINTVDKFTELDEDQIDQLCSACRKVGKNPPHNGHGGYNVGIISQTNFKRASFYCKYLKMTSRVVTHEDINLTNATSIKDFKKEIEAKSKPDEDPQKPVQNKAFEFFENFREYLDDYIGTISGRPLTYVVRPDTVVLDSDIDPGFGHPDSSYGTYYKEIEARAPIKSFTNNRVRIDPYFAHDNVLVWKILYTLLKGSNYLTYIKEFIPKQDGREAYKALQGHLLGQQAINTYAARAENALHNLHLDGTKKSTNWNLDKYVQAHIEQHVILEKLTKYGHKGIGESQKIHYFLQGITAPNLLNVKSSLAVNPKATFTETSMAFKTYAAAEPELKRSTKQNVHIAQVSSSGGRKNDKPYKGPTRRSDGYDPNADYSSHKLPNRFYTKEEWPKLTKGQRNYLRSSRKSIKKENKDSKRKIAELTATLKELKKASSAARKQDEDDDSKESPASSDDDESVKAKRRKRTTVTTKRR